MRLFIAFEVSDAIRRRCGEFQEALKRGGRKVTWTKRERMHVTLKFLGEVDDDVVSLVEETVFTVAAGAEPSAVTFEGAGAFPSPAKPRVLVVGAPHVPQPLARLHAELETQLASLGFEREKRVFRPHLTLGRLRDRERGPAKPWPGLAELADASVGTQEVAEVVLFKSTLRPEGPRYEVVVRAPLGKT